MVEGPHAVAKLVKNGTLLVRARVDPWDETSHMVIVELKAGDFVSVVCDSATADFYGFKYLSFSGFLLYDYSDVNPGPVVGK